jgi:hypothetical protein
MGFPQKLRVNLINSNDNEFIEQNSSIYTSSELYPLKLIELLYQTDLAGQSMVALRINPIQYNPNEQKLIFYSSISFSIVGDYGNICSHYLPEAVSELSKLEYDKMVRDMVVNPSDVELITTQYSSFQTSVEPGNFDYVIITSSSFQTYFQSLADWKTKKGIPAKIVTTTWIYSQYSGNNVERIHAFIMDAHSTWGATYFLLGGDTGHIPTRFKTIHDENTPNDTYYADYDSNWTCNVHVGRASVTSYSTINIFKNKVMTYEKNPPLANYCEKVAMYAFDLDDATISANLKRSIYGYYNYIPSDWVIDTVYDNHGGNHKSNVINSINTGHNLINHSDHSNTYIMGTGDYDHNWYLGTSDVDNFNNGSKQSILYSIGCWPCAYDYSACIAEHFVRDSNGGGVAFIGNARSGLYYQGNYNSLSMLYDRYFFRSLFHQGHYKLGAAFSDHKNDGPTGSNAERHIFTTLTLLGDPEMPVWTNAPANMIVNHPDTIPPSSGIFTVHVEDSDSSDIYMAYVCLMKDTVIYETGLTNTNGDIEFSLSPSSLGTMYVTVTKKNYLPIESEVVIDEFLGAIGGTVKNAVSEPIAGAIVYSTSPVFEDTTDSFGNYVLYGFDPGAYNVVYSHPGFLDSTMSGISVTEGDTTRVHVQLSSLPNDVGVSSIISPSDTIVMNTPVIVSCEVNNYGTEMQTFDIIFEAQVLNSSNIEFTDTISLFDVPGYSIDTISGFNNFYPSLDTIYVLKSYTNLSTDMNNANDTTLESSSCIQGVSLWYGNLDSSPMLASIGNTIDVDVYIATSPSVYVADMLICLGSDDLYIDSLLSLSDGVIHYPLTTWEVAQFLSPDSNPPNPPGWSSQAFYGFASLGRAKDSPWLHVETPTKIITFAAKIVDDPGIVGQTLPAIGKGLNIYQGPTNMGDTLGNFGYPVYESFNQLHFIENALCDYIPGDMNGNGVVIGSDVTYGVRYFSGMGNPPPDSCYNAINSSWLYSAADCNGDCVFIGSDVVFLVNYFNGNQPEIKWCSQTPPSIPQIISNERGVILKDKVE